MINLLFLALVASATTTTTTLSPDGFNKNFIDLCKVKTAALSEPYKTRVKKAQDDAHCEER